MLNLQHGTDEIGTRVHFIRAWTTYLHGPSTDKMGTGANFIRAVLQFVHLKSKQQNFSMYRAKQMEIKYFRILTYAYIN